jgi:cation diffusion facilitator CzcD-associated flavoprotein CzcO
VLFTFVVEHEGLVGKCFGILSFVPDGERWEVWMLRTMLENFEGHGNPDDPLPIFKSLPAPSLASLQHEYGVIIIGAGQSGLSLAGRLGALGIKYVLLEKEKEIGWSWTGKYDSVRQHTIREMNNLPFERTFREDDPMLLPASTVARGFKEYVEKYKINIWLSAETEICRRKEGGWVLGVRVGGSEEQVVELKARHLVLSMGAGRSVPNPPKIPGIESFKGEIKHIGNYKNAYAWKGKSGIVVGSATAAHDVAQDMLDSGLSSVTMIQRRATPIFSVDWLVVGQSSKNLLSSMVKLADKNSGL